MIMFCTVIAGCFLTPLVAHCHRLSTHILIQESSTGTIVLRSPQVYVFQLALLDHLLRTVTGTQAVHPGSLFG